MENDRQEFMLGQLYYGTTDTKFGSMFRNEMEYHVFTRTRDGFCDKCDLDPLERTDDEGYKLPAHLFHSAASQFSDSYFNNDWTTDKIFVDSQPLNVRQVTVFPYDDEGDFIGALVPSQKDQLKLLAGTYGESLAARDFLMAQGPQYGLKLRVEQLKVVQLIRDYPKDFEFYLGDSDSLPSHVVSTIIYGCEIMVRFEKIGLAEDEMDDLAETVNFFARCLEGGRDPVELEKLAPCDVVIGPDSMESDNQDMSGCVETDLRCAFDEVNNLVKKALSANHGKGLVIKRRTNHLTYYQRFSFDPGDRVWALSKAIAEPVPKYSEVREYNLGSFSPVKLYMEVNRLLEILRVEDNKKAISLRKAFERNLKEFQEELTATRYAIDIGKMEVSEVLSLINQFRKSVYSPSRTKRLLKYYKKNPVVEETTM